MNWNFERNDTTEYKVLPEGVYRIRIKSADKAVSKSGNDMLALQFEVSGSNTILYHYIVFMQDRPEITNRNLTRFFDSFKDIKEGDLDTKNWIGKVGACMIKHEEYNGKEQAKIDYFIHKDKQSALPPWKDPATTEKATNTGDFLVEDTSDDDLPF